MSKEETGEDVKCVLTGWGSTGKYASGPYPNDLQELHPTTISNEDCKADKSYWFITGTNLCTHTVEGQGACT